MESDFTQKKYCQLCQSIIESSYTVLTLNQHLERSKSPSKLVIMRHDVDRKPLNALRIARIENRMGLCATYYFRYTRSVFIPWIMREIVALGHEIGYHYETLSSARGDYKKAITIFESALSEIRKISTVKSISMHGRPLSKWDNRDIWDKYDFKKYGLVGEAYISIDYNTLSYFSDTGRTWHKDRYNIRDHVTGMPLPKVETTNQLIDLIRGDHFDQICILTHPNRWASTGVEWIKEYCADFLINLIKRGIRWHRK